MTQHEEDASRSIGAWYAEHIDEFPDIYEAPCPHCGPEEWVILHPDGTDECYACGANIDPSARPSEVDDE